MKLRHLSGLLVLMSAQVVAQPVTHWYFGAEVLDTEYDISANQTQGPFGAGTETFITTPDETGDSGWRIFGGYQFSRYFAVEGSIFDFGDFSRSGDHFIDDATLFDFDGNSAVVSLDGTAVADISQSGLSATSVAIWPVNNRFSVRARLGVSLVSSDVSVRTVDVLPEVTLGETTFPETIIRNNDDDDESSTAIHTGIEASYRWAWDWSTSVYFERNFDIDGGGINGDADLDVIGLRVIYHY
jgi:hypothetical protein